jgi:hypothetical protein
MRERLIQLIKHDNCINPYNCSDKCKYVELDDCHSARLADYLLENGVVVLPCKVGDKLYAISENRIVECTCEDINLRNDVTITADFECDYDCKGCPFNDWKQDFHTGEYSCGGEYGTWFFSEKDIGKTVFLSREEAERALKGGD